MRRVHYLSRLLLFLDPPQRSVKDSLRRPHTLPLTPPIFLDPAQDMEYGILIIPVQVFLFNKGIILSLGTIFIIIISTSDPTLVLGQLPDQEELLTTLIILLSIILSPLLVFIATLPL